MPEDILAACDPLVVNETEASELVGFDVHDSNTARAAGGQLRARSRSVVITIGSRGAVWADSETIPHQPAAVTDVVDTTGAGDAFVGALASRLAQGSSLREAVQTGVRVGSFAVGSLGAQSSYPTLTGVEPSRI